MDIEEELVGLYHTIDSLLDSREKKLVQFLGSVEGEGVSSLAGEYARVAADVFGRSVLLVDGSESSVSEPMGEESRSTFEELLSRQLPLNDVIVRSDQDPYATVRPETLGASLSVLFSSPRLPELFELLKDRFDIVVFDSPAANASPDGLAVARKVDGVVLVVEAESTRWPVVENVRERIQKVGGNILGVVLNKQKRYIPPGIYNRL